MDCPICGEGSGHKHYEQYGIYRMLQCGNCDLVFSDPMLGMNSSDYEVSYGDQGHHEDFSTSLGIGHRKFLSRNKPPGRVLDVGTSTGLFPSLCQDKGFDAVGIDFDQKAISLGQKIFTKVTLLNATLTEYADRIDGRKFDYVTLFEIVEHVEAPLDILKQSYELLKPGGCVVVFVPNRRRTPQLYKEMVDRGVDMPPHHLTKWSRSALQQLLASSTFTNIDVMDIGKYRFPWLPSLGIASRIRKRVLSYDNSDGGATSKEAIAIDKSRVQTYDILANFKMIMDQALFCPVDLYYKARGYERDGLYAEAVRPM